MSAATKHLWSEGQLLAYRSLIETADLYFLTNWSDFPIQPRLSPLIVGPSGHGKSHLVRAVAEEFGVPVMRLTASNWIVGGAKETTPTLLRVHQFVTENEQGILHFDELDKFKIGSSDWSAYVVGELFDLLDRSPSQPTKDVEWTANILKKLRHDFLIVGSGTWQSVWADSGKAKMGFQTKESRGSILESVKQSIATTEVIPQELLRRFNQEVIALPPASLADYQTAAEKFGLLTLANELRVQLDLNEAVKSELGARWLEEQLGKLLLKARRENRTDLIDLRPYVPEESIDREEDEENDINPSPL